MPLSRSIAKAEVSPERAHLNPRLRDWLMRGDSGLLSLLRLPEICSWFAMLTLVLGDNSC